MVRYEQWFNLDLEYEKEEMTWEKAKEKYGDSLPTRGEFETAERHGLREIMGIDSGYFWSSSSNPYNVDYAYGFNGYDGYVGYYYRDSYPYAALCVSR